MGSNENKCVVGDLVLPGGCLEGVEVSKGFSLTLALLLVKETVNQRTDNVILFKDLQPAINSI